MASIVIRVLRRLRGSRFVRSVAVLAGGTAMGQAITIAAAPLLTRLYTPEDFGVLGVYASMLAMCAVAASLRYELAIPIAEKDEESAAVVVLALSIIPASALLLGLLLWFFSDVFLSWTEMNQLQGYLWLLPLGVGLVGLYQVFSFWAIRRKAFRRIAQTKLTQGAAAVVLQITLYSLGPLGLLFGHIAGSVAGVTSLFSLAWKNDRSVLATRSVTDMGYVAKRYRGFPQFSVIAGLADSAALQLPILLLAVFFDPFVAGQFTIVNRVAAWPLALIGQAIAQIYFRHGAETLSSSPVQKMRGFLRLSSYLAIMSLIPLLLLVAGGPWLFGFVFGEQWAVAGQYSRVLAIALCTQFVVSSLSNTLYIVEGQSWDLAWTMLRLLVVASAFCGARAFGANALQAIAAYSAGMTVAYGALFLLEVVLLRRYIAKAAT